MSINRCRSIKAELRNLVDYPFSISSSHCACLFALIRHIVQPVEYLPQQLLHKHLAQESSAASYEQTASLEAGCNAVHLVLIDMSNCQLAIVLLV